MSQPQEGPEHQHAATRRQFLGGVGLTGVAGVALASGVWKSGVAEAAENRGLLPPNAATGRSYVTGKAFLDLEGVNSGYLDSVDGGSAYGEVVKEAPGADRVVHKHIGNVHYEPFTVSFGTAMGKDTYEWITSTLAGKAERHAGRVALADHNFKVQSAIEFTNALVTEIGFPALDAGGKDRATISLKFAPEVTRHDPNPSGSGDPLKDTAKVQKAWLSSNFRIKIDGLDTSKVNKIDELVVKQVVGDQAVGELREFEKVAYHLDVPNLAISLAQSSAKDWFSWLDSFVVKGNNGPDQEKGGTLEYLSSDFKTVLFTLNFAGLGIFRLAPDRVQAGAETIQRVRAEMYCEKITFGNVSAAS